MPIVSIFFGIVIRIYHGDHSPPHFHASYGEFEAIFEIKSGKILKGRLPPKAIGLVLEWRRKNFSAINLAWDTVAAMRAPKRIKGLE